MSAEREADRIAAHTLSSVSGDLGVHPLRSAHPGSIGRFGTPGKPLDTSTRAYFEPRVGRDLRSVRVHTDARAGRLADAVDAEAMTIGHDIAFGSGRYRPATPAGRALMAHELAHVTQHGHAAPAIRRKIKVGAGLQLNTRGFSFQKEGNVYSSDVVAKNSVWNEIFSSMLRSPRVFQIAGSTNEQVEGNLLRHMKARLDIIKFAMNKKYGFAAGDQYSFNPDFWVSEKNKPLRPRAGVRPQAAIDDLGSKEHGPLYAIACQDATLITMLSGAPEATIVLMDTTDETDWIPGDQGYMRNRGFQPGRDAQGLEGENLIYLGLGRFWGHLSDKLEVRTLMGWRLRVYNWNHSVALGSQRKHNNVGLIGMSSAGD